MNNIIEIKDLTKKYDNFTLGPLNIEIPKGMIVGLIGENGAGKTTLIKCILNIIKESSGEIKINGKEKEKDFEDIGVVLDNSFFPEILTASNINNIMKSIYKHWDSKLYNDYLKKFNIPSNKPLKTLSCGMHKKLEIITAMSHHPKLLILDEPTSGLDPVVRHEVLDLFMNFIQNEENSILLSTHITSDLEHIADKIIFINEGQVIFNEDSPTLLNNYGILKCTNTEFNNLDKKDILAYMKNKYNVDVLIKDLNKVKKKYKDFVIDKITLEDLMVLMIKGEKIC